MEVKQGTNKKVSSHVISVGINFVSGQSVKCSEEVISHWYTSQKYFRVRCGAPDCWGPALAEYVAVNKRPHRILDELFYLTIESGHLLPLVTPFQLIVLIIINLTLLLTVLFAAMVR